MEEIVYWLWLTVNRKLGNKKILDALNIFGDIRALYEADFERLSKVGMFSEQDIENLCDKGLSAAERELEAARKKGIDIISFTDEYYPPMLKDLYDAPPVLYVRGNCEALVATPAIAFVGARRASCYGIETAMKLSKELAEYGINIISGLAVGIDGAAHRGALIGGGTTVGVMGCGLDVLYPHENRALIDEIVEKGGAIISEFKLGTEPLAQNFPVRNRLISALASGVVVVEAGIRSGALITARLAYEQNRDVFAVPGNITSPLSTGTNMLVRDGAKMVTCSQDIISEYDFGTKPRIISSKKRVINEENNHNTNFGQSGEDSVSLILRFLDKPRTVDELAGLSGTEVSILNGLLTLLEIKGAIKTLPGNRYIKINGKD